MSTLDQEAFSENFDNLSEFHNLVQEKLHNDGTLVCLVWAPHEPGKTLVGQAIMCHDGELITRRFSVKATKTDFKLKLMGRSYFAMSDYFEGVV